MVLLLSLLQSWLLAPRSVEIPYSKFLELLRADRIERVALTEVTGYLAQHLVGC